MGNQSKSGFIGGRDHPARSGIPDGIGRLISLSAALLRGCHSLTAALIETNKSTLCSHFIQVSHSVQGDSHLLASANTYIHTLYIYILCICMHTFFFFSAASGLPSFLWANLLLVFRKWRQWNHPASFPVISWLSITILAVGQRLMPAAAVE